MLSPRNFFGLLDDSNPVGEDSRTISDDQHREILGSCKQQFPNLTGAVTATQDDLNNLTGLGATGGKVMTGTPGITVGWFYNDTPPIGWSPLEPDQEIRNLTIGPAAGGGAIGGSDDVETLPVNTTVTVNLPAATSEHVLDITQIPNHNHTIPGRTSAGGNTDRVSSAGADGSFPNPPTSSVGGGLGHSHGIGGTAAGTGTGTIAPRYARGTLATLDA